MTSPRPAWRMRLRTKLFLGFAMVVLFFAVLSAWFGVGLIQTQNVREAQDRVRQDLQSAWGSYRGRLDGIALGLELGAGYPTVAGAVRDDRWADPALAARLDDVGRLAGLDFLGIVDAEGVVRFRAGAGEARDPGGGDDPLIASALRGQAGVGTQVFSASRLEAEGEGLAARARLDLRATERARARDDAVETRGLVLMAAVPVPDGDGPVGVLYGGVLLNRNLDLVDTIRDTLYGDRLYQGRPFGTATIFLGDARIATTVLRETGERALGTLLSSEVAESVLDREESWVDRAFVVYDWYLAAYDPIHDPQGEVVGILYVGILERPFRDLAVAVIWRYVGLAAAATLGSLVIALPFASWVARPIQRLAGAARQLEQGAYPSPVSARLASEETAELIQAFNEMAAALQEREQKLAEANRELTELNRNYMEMLGFVTHNLNTPLASMMNYAYLLRTEKAGPLTDRQRKAVGVIDHTVRRMGDMTRRYLNLSRIESGHLTPAPTRIQVADLVRPVADGFEPGAAEAGMRIAADLPEGAELHADPGHVREILDNLIGNAVKYGRTGGTITVAAAVDGGRIRFRVHNDGEPIPPEQQARLFRKYVRLQAGERSAFLKGTGLGLFICRHMVEAHGGQIELVTGPGLGVEFRFDLPRWAGKPEQAAEAAAGSAT